MIYLELGKLRYLLGIQIEQFDWLLHPLVILAQLNHTLISFRPIINGTVMAIGIGLQLLIQQMLSSFHEHFQCALSRSQIPLLQLRHSLVCVCQRWLPYSFDALEQSVHDTWLGLVKVVIFPALEPLQHLSILFLVLTDDLLAVGVYVLGRDLRIVERL